MICFRTDQLPGIETDPSLATNTNIRLILLKKEPRRFRRGQQLKSPG